MKIVTGRIVSTKPVGLSKAANVLSNFVTSDNGASQSVSAYLRRASTAFHELAYFKKHHKLKKHRQKDESSKELRVKPREPEGNEARVLENGHQGHRLDRNTVGSDEEENDQARLRKIEKEKKRAEGGLGSEKNGDIEVEEDNVAGEEMKTEKKKKKKRKNTEYEGGDVGNSEKKKKRRSEPDD